MTAKQSLECFPYSVKGNLQKLELLMVTKHCMAYYFETVRKIGNERLTKYCRKPVVAKRTINTKKVLLKKTDQEKKLLLVWEHP